MLTSMLVAPVHGSQRGVALISVLLIVVIATVLSIAMIKHQNLSIHRARNSVDHGQARQYALGGEELARQILWEDFTENDQRDHLLEQWAEPMAFDFDDGEVLLQIVDLQGRININSLSIEGVWGKQTQQRLRLLLSQLGVDAMHLDRALDWIDDDDSVRNLGAEDYDYLGLERPYRSAGQLVSELSELRLLLDMDAETFDMLVPYLSVMPEPRTSINVNTADAQVLQTLSPALTAGIAEELIAVRRDESGFESVMSFLQSPYVAGMGIADTGLSVQSAFFEVRVQARYVDRYAYLTSVVHRSPTTGRMRVVYRNLSRRVSLLDPRQEEAG